MNKVKTAQSKFSPGGCAGLVLVGCLAVLTVMSTIKIGLIWFG